MKKDIHPENYRFVVFQDMSNGYSFLSKSCAPSKETVKWEDGNEYPLVKLEISHTSHPFFTGKMKLVDTAGRIDKFKNRYARHLKKDGAAAEAPVAEAPEPIVEEAPAAEAAEEVVEAVEESPAVETSAEAASEADAPQATEDDAAEAETAEETTEDAGEEAAEETAEGDESNEGDTPESEEEKTEE